MLVDIGVPITNLTIECLDYSLFDCSIGSSLFLMSPEVYMANAHEMITCKPPNHQCIWVLVLPVTCPKLNFLKHLLPKFGMIFFQHWTNWPNKCQWQDNDWSMDSDDSPAKCGTKVPQIAWPGLGSMIHHDSWPNIIRLCNSRNLSWDLAWVTQNCEGDFYPSQNDWVRRRSFRLLKYCWWFRTPVKVSLHPPKFKSSPLKNDGWKRILSFWVSAYFQGLLRLNFGWVRSQLLQGPQGCNWLGVEHDNTRKTRNPGEVPNKIHDHQIASVVPQIQYITVFPLGKPSRMFWYRDTVSLQPVTTLR